MRRYEYEIIKYYITTLKKMLKRFRGTKDEEFLRKEIKKMGNNVNESS